MTRTAVLNLLAGIVIGIALGLLYSWQVDPVKYTDMSPDSLHADHKTDYVVMIAQAYVADGNLELARTRLATLNFSNPGQYVADLTTFEIQRGAPLDDLRALSALAAALGAAPPPLP
jgi:hypothetical protein